MSNFLGANLALSQIKDLSHVFFSSPYIYSFLLLLSVSAFVIWLYGLLAFRTKEIMPRLLINQLQTLLSQKNYEEADALCQSNPKLLLAAIIRAGLCRRKYGVEVMLEAMKSEGNRASVSFWQRLSLLNDIAIIAPMLGLLGTVIGMFYAFYDVNRSVESINALFDGLGIAVGTTVMGLVVAIFSMVFCTTLKYRLVKNLRLVESETIQLSRLIEPDPC